MDWIQRHVTLSARSRGFHLVTKEVLDQVSELSEFEVGIAHVFIQHTSAGLTLNENASPAVLHDFEEHFDRMVPENQPYYKHTVEGPDDMPAHIKASLLGSSLSIPVRDGHLDLGTWQGIYLCEHRNQGGRRTLVITIYGQRRDG